jgi:intracellular septation protein A
MELFKQLLPGLLPLLIFVAADEIWGTKIGLIVAVAVGILELIYHYVKNKTIERFIADVALLTVLGLVSIALENDIFFKMKPALIQLILCGILGVSAFSSKNLLMMMSQRYLRNMKLELQEEQISAMRRTTKFLFFIVLFHTILVIYSALYMSKESWAFISGGLFYIIFGIFFVTQIIVNRIRAKRYYNKINSDK